MATTLLSSLTIDLRDIESGRVPGLICCASKGGVDRTVDAGDHASVNDRERGSHEDMKGAAKAPFFIGPAVRLASPFRGGRASGQGSGEHENVANSSPIEGMISKPATTRRWGENMAEKMIS